MRVFIYTKNSLSCLEWWELRWLHSYIHNNRRFINKEGFNNVVQGTYSDSKIYKFLLIK